MVGCVGDDDGCVVGVVVSGICVGRGVCLRVLLFVFGVRLTEIPYSILESLHAPFPHRSVS